MINKKNKFIEFMLSCGVLKFGDFTLKSGRKSPYFINTGLYNKGRELDLLGDYYAELIETSMAENEKVRDFDVLFGPAYKGIPLATITAAKLQKDVYVSFNRKEVKDHGDVGSFLGYVPKSGNKIAVIEDVTTAGTSIRETIDLLKNNGIDAKITALYISVDRMEKGTDDISATKQISRDFGIDVYSIVSITDIVEYLDNSGDSAQADKIREYLNKFGAVN
ncbi:MAG: orotate phosphoribosyltransferase [Ruminococcus sp.]|jgi:orotate phosphoribosyltransferase|nr:orotate phosphoribosyltransferase [Ruminococcus sp.]